MTRVVYTILAAVLVLIAPYWLYLPAILLGVVVFPLYLEAIPLGLVVDVLYGTRSSLLFAFPFGIIAALTVLAAAPLRQYLRFNA